MGSFRFGLPPYPFAISAVHHLDLHGQSNLGVNAKKELLIVFYLSINDKIGMEIFPERFRRDLPLCTGLRLLNGFKASIHCA